MSFPRFEVASCRRASTAARRVRVVFVGAFGACVLPSSSAWAAESDPAAQQLTPIIVKAERQPAAEQRTPIAMSVYGDAFIESTGVSDIKSLATIAPDLNYAQVQTV
ncbi:hypothetical protein PQR08_22945, partial [Caballeronia jiangsuensis]